MMLKKYNLGYFMRGESTTNNEDDIIRILLKLRDHLKIYCPR